MLMTASCNSIFLMATLSLKINQSVTFPFTFSAKIRVSRFWSFISKPSNSSVLKNLKFTFLMLTSVFSLPARFPAILFTSHVCTTENCSNPYTTMRKRIKYKNTFSNIFANLRRAVFCAFKIFGKIN